MQFDLSPAIARIDAMVNGAIAMLPNLLIAALVFGLFLAIAIIGKRLTKRLLRGHASPGLGTVLGRVAQWLVYFVGLLVALSIVVPTFKAGDLVQILGIGGVAIGFAFRDILQNFLAGILILLSRPFRIGDQIIFKEFEGTVENILTRATFVKTYDGRRVVIPNAELFTNAVLVNTAFAVRRTEFEFGIRYADDFERTRELLLATLPRIEGVLERPAADVLLLVLGESSINVRARWWTKSIRADVLRAHDQVIRTMLHVFADNGIEIAFPTRTIILQPGQGADGASPIASERPQEHRQPARQGAEDERQPAQTWS